MTEPTLTALESILAALPTDLRPEVWWSIERELVAWDIGHLEAEVLELAAEVAGEDTELAELASRGLRRERALLAVRRARLAELDGQAVDAEQLRRLWCRLAELREIDELEELFAGE